MKNNNKMIIYKPSVFNKIKNFIKSFFRKSRHKKEETARRNKKSKKNSTAKTVRQRKEEKERIEELKRLYESGKVTEDEISDKDIDKLIELYKEETEKFDLETQMLNESMKRIKENLEEILKK